MVYTVAAAVYSAVSSGTRRKLEPGLTMLDKLKSLFQTTPDSIRLTEVEPDMRVAVCALLLEAAEVDQQVPEEERLTIRRLLMREYELDQAAVEELIEATHKARGEMSDLWPFTHAIARAYSSEQKLDLLEMVWLVIFADDKLDPYEDQLARRLQQMLSVNHSVLMEAKSRARKSGPLV